MITLHLSYLKLSLLIWILFAPYISIAGYCIHREKLKKNALLALLGGPILWALIFMVLVFMNGWKIKINKIEKGE